MLFLLLSLSSLAAAGGAIVQGTVEDPSGRPSSGVRVMVESPQGAQQWTTTDALGRFLFRVSPGRYHLIVPGDAAIRGERIEIVAVPGGDVGARIRRRAGPTPPLPERPEPATTTAGAGLVFGHTWGAVDGWSVGAEGSALHFPRGSPIGIGGFGQLEYHRGGSARIAGGLQLGENLGLEIGLAHRTAAEGRGPTTGLAIGGYLSFAVFSLGVRATLAPSDGSSYGRDLAFVTTLKLPFGGTPRFNRALSGLFGWH